MSTPSRATAQEALSNIRRFVMCWTDCAYDGSGEEIDLEDLALAHDTLESMRSERDELLAVALGYQEVRKLQRAYFKSRTQENLIASKQAEKTLDAQARDAIKKAAPNEEGTT